MINLFDRIYIKHDNVMSRNEGQQKLIITDKSFKIPYVSEKLAQIKTGIAGVYTSLEDADAANGDRSGLWTMLRLKATKVIIIARKDYVAELLIQYWKSLFKTTTADSLYTLYTLYVNNENLHSYRPAERKTRISSPDTTEELIVKLTKEEFQAIYDKTDATPAMESIEKRYLPFELLLMSYIADATDNDEKKALFAKIDAIMRKNIVAKLAGSRQELLYETHNYYLLNPGSQEELITDPIAYLKSNPRLEWIVDDIFEYGKEEEILAKYSLNQIKFFFEMHKRLTGDTHDEIKAIDFVQNKQYAALIESDINDHRGNYFGTTAFVNKINGFLVSYMYQLKRLGLTDKLNLYDLK